MHIDQLDKTEGAALLEKLEQAYTDIASRKLSLDLTRGKPGVEQLALSNPLDGILRGNYTSANGVDTRNYAGLEGLPEARALCSQILGTPVQETLVGGNASLSLMYTTLELAMTEGLRGPQSAWGNDDSVKFICPVPGYDRHFAVCEHLGIEMLTVPMLEHGPDMDQVESLVKADHSIRGMWCVPRFSNPTGCVYSDATVARIAGLGKIAADNFLVMWDNAYAVHALYEDAAPLASIHEACVQHRTLDNVFQFGSSSKITFAGAGISFAASSEDNLKALVKHISFQTIGPDKVNQLRHVRFLKDLEGVNAHMAAHAQILRPRFEAVLEILERELGNSGMGSWLSPRGGYFISFDTLPGLAQEVVRLAAEIGVKLTPAGATYPYGNDPQDKNIRLAPTFPALDDVIASAEAFVLCVKLATLRQQQGA